MVGAVAVPFPRLARFSCLALPLLLVPLGSGLLSFSLLRAVLSPGLVALFSSLAPVSLRGRLGSLPLLGLPVVLLAFGSLLRVFAASSRPWSLPLPGVLVSRPGGGRCLFLSLLPAPVARLGVFGLGASAFLAVQFRSLRGFAPFFAVSTRSRRSTRNKKHHPTRAGSTSPSAIAPPGTAAPTSRRDARVPLSLPSRTARPTSPTKANTPATVAVSYPHQRPPPNHTHSNHTKPTAPARSQPPPTGPVVPPHPIGGHCSPPHAQKPGFRRSTRKNSLNAPKRAGKHAHQRFRHSSANPQRPTRTAQAN